MDAQNPNIVAFGVTDAARYAALGRSTLYNAISAGELRAHKIGKRTIVMRDDLHAWLVSHPAYSAETKADCPANRAA